MATSRPSKLKISGVDHLLVYQLNRTTNAGSYKTPEYMHEYRQKVVVNGFFVCLFVCLGFFNIYFMLYKLKTEENKV